MKRPVSLLRNVWIILLSVIVCLNSFSQEGHQEKKNRYRPQQFENEARAKWQKVGEVIQKIGLKEGQTIADIGGGSGYFSRPFARTVGPRGTVYCCDLATNLMDYLQKRAWEEGLLNIVTVYAAPDRPMLPPGSVDHLFFCDTNHHLENRVEYYTKLFPLLKPNGQLVVIDWRKKKQKVGPPPGHNVAKETLVSEMKEAGWKVVKDWDDVLEYQYFLIFKPER